MEEWLHLVTKDAVVIIDAMALIVVAVGTAEAFFTGLWAAFPASASRRRFREILAEFGDHDSLAPPAPTRPSPAMRGSPRTAAREGGRSGGREGAGGEK